MFVKTIPNPISAKDEFAMVQEACQTEIERAFSVLQPRFAIVHGLDLWDKKTLNNIMTTRTILHNMILEDERDLNLEFLQNRIFWFTVCHCGVYQT
jgi:hypothetical protein